MKKQFLMLALILCSTVFYAQNATISIGPKTFQKGVACKINLPQATDIVVRVFDANTEVKNFKFDQIKSEGFKMNLEELVEGKTYTISVFNAKEELFYTREIIKANK